MLMGEHAVLRGQPAIVCAINKRMKVTLTPREDKAVLMHSALGEHETEQAIHQGNPDGTVQSQQHAAHPAHPPGNTSNLQPIRVRNKTGKHVLPTVVDHHLLVGWGILAASGSVDRILLCDSSGEHASQRNGTKGRRQKNQRIIPKTRNSENQTPLDIGRVCVLLLLFLLAMIVNLSSSFVINRRFIEINRY